MTDSHESGQFEQSGILAFLTNVLNIFPITVESMEAAKNHSIPSQSSIFFESQTVLWFLSA